VPFAFVFAATPCFGDLEQLTAAIGVPTGWPVAAPAPRVAQPVG
jgi:hypothetical protein